MQVGITSRVTLAKSVIEAISAYARMANVFPVASIDEIQRSQRNFIWGNTTDKKIAHGVKWDTLTKPKIYGGLGLRNLKAMNRSYLMKLSWKLLTNSNDFRSRVIRGFYLNTGRRDQHKTSRKDSSF